MHFPNAFIGKTKTDIPEVGMGATEVFYSDRHAYTITKVSSSKKTFWMKRDKAERIDKNGMSDCQTYSYTPDPEGAEIRVSKRTDGTWKSKGGQKVWLGVRDEHYDYSF